METRIAVNPITARPSDKHFGRAKIDESVAELKEEKSLVSDWLKAFLPHGLSRAWPRCRSKRRRSVRAWSRGRQGARCRRRPRNGCARLSLVAPSNLHRINTPALAGPSVVASHSPPESTSCRTLNGWEVHHCRDETSRITAPCLTTGDGASSIGANRTVVTPHHKGAGGNFLKRISTISAELEHAPIETDSGINVRGFKIEVLPE